jgi:hypothetical protein
VEPRTSRRRTAAIWAALIIGVGIVTVILIRQLPRLSRNRSLIGAVLTASTDPRKQLPVANVEITSDAGGTIARTKSDASGYFRLNWRAKIWEGESVALTFRHPDYQPLDITQPLRDEIYVARMKPVAPLRVEPQGKQVSISNIRVRYSVNGATTVNIGSTQKTLEVVNTGNVPCEGRSPCSPNGKWKAAIGSMSLKAGNGQEFQNVRVSCISGPCPFTKIESDGFSHGGPEIEVSVRAWSDTVVFLVEAEVMQSIRSEAVRHAYPSIFGEAMSFTLPANGEGPSVEADVDGLGIVFPLGPDLNLSWAACTVQVAANATKLYTCKLKPGHRFR